MGLKFNFRRIPVHWRLLIGVQLGLSGAIMMLPWLRHLPFVRDKFLASKKAPLKMRKMQVMNRAIKIIIR